MDGSAGRFNFAARWTLISVPNVRFRGYRWMWWCCTVFFATYQAAKRGCMIAGSDRGRIAPHYRSQQPRRCVSLLAAQIGIVWGAKARRPVWSLPGGFAVRLAHASHAERNRVMGRAVNWSRKAHQTQGTLMRTVHLTGASLLLLGLLFCRLDGASAQGSDAARQACTPDAMRLCSDVIPDVGRVTACMKAKYSQLSQPCRVAMRGGTAHGHGHYHGHYHHHYHH